MLNIVIIIGELVGIGFDIIVVVLLYLVWQVLLCYVDVQWYVIGDVVLLQVCVDVIGQGDFWCVVFMVLIIVECLLGVLVCVGVFDVVNGCYVLNLFDVVIDGCQIGMVDGVCYDVIVMVLVQKSMINDVGVLFIGYIEYLVECSYMLCVVMMFVGLQLVYDNVMLCVVLVMMYLLLCEVLDVIMFMVFDEMLDIVQCDLYMCFGLVVLCIFVMGLNLYVGELGYFGCEEIEVIELVIVCVCVCEIDVYGLYFVDMLFQLCFLVDVDCVLVMYYD